MYVLTGSLYLGVAIGLPVAGVCLMDRREDVHPFEVLVLAGHVDLPAPGNAKQQRCEHAQTQDR
jgi:hypothetical protein